ncbi:MAG: protein kinase family protein [Pseudanabaenaceae cyanobacterium]
MTDTTVLAHLGQLVGEQYRLQELLTASPTVQVYRARRETLEPDTFCEVRRYAPRMGDRLSLEKARLLFALETTQRQQLSAQCDRVPRWLGAWEEQEAFWVAETPVPGAPWGGPHPPTQVVPWLLAALAVLEMAHALGLVHGNLHPDHLLLDGETVYVTGFAGLERLASPWLVDAADPLAVPIPGTPSYSPPLQTTAPPQPAFDLHALAVTALQTLTGKHPSELTVPTLDLELQTILEGAIAGDYATAAQLATALRQWQGEDVPPPPRRLWTKWGLGLGAIALVPIAAGIWHWGRSVTPPTTTAPPPEPPPWAQRRLLVGHREPVSGLAFFGNGISLVSGSRDRTLRLWNATTGENFATLSNHLGFVTAMTAVAAHPRLSVFASGGLDGRVRLWDLRGARPLVAVGGHRRPVTALQFDATGDRLVSSSVDGTLRLWRWATQQREQTLGETEPVAAFALHHTQLLSAGRDVLRIWQIPTGQTIAQHKEELPITALARHGTTLALGRQDGTLRFGQSTANLPLQFREPIAAHTGPVTALLFSPDGQWLFSGGQDGQLRLWHVGDRRPAATLIAKGAPIRALAHSPNQPLLAIAQGSQIAIWEASATPPPP